MFASIWIPLYSDPAIDSRPAFFVPVYSALLGSTVDTSFASISGEFHIFHVNWWITDPEVDSRLSGVSDSHLFVASPEEYIISVFWEKTSGIISVFSTLGFDSGYMSLSGYEAFGSFSHVFTRDLWRSLRIVSVLSAALGSTAGTCTASIYGACEEAPPFFFVVSLGDDFMLSPYSALSLVRQRIHALRHGQGLPPPLGR